MKNSSNVGNTIELNAVAFCFDEKSQLYSSFLDKFNEYSEENNLNITIKLNLLTSKNDGYAYDNYGTLIEALLKKNKNNYDIYFYESNCLSVYSSYFLDLKKYLSKELIELYDSKILSELCIYDNKLVGLPFYIIYSVFYSNEPILKQYNKTTPKTWDEMIDTGKLILTEERNKNNTDLIGFNGLFSDDDQGIFSIYEFIYSFRDSVDEYFLEVGSPTFINALKMMKKVKNEISSDKIFHFDEEYTFNKIIDGQSIFLKFWILDGKILDNIPYKVTFLPGSKEGISSSIVSGINIGVSNNVNNEKLKAIVTALEFIMSKEIQKEYLSNRQLISGIKSLYCDEEVCNEIDCELFKTLQPIKDPFITLKWQSSYTTYFKEYIYDFLYGNDTAEEVSQKIIDLTKIYYISLDTTYSKIGLIIEEGQNYQICKPTNTLCQLIIILKWIYIIFIIFTLLLLIFIEWNISTLHYDLLFFTSVLYIDILTIFSIWKKQNIRIQFINKINDGFIESNGSVLKSKTLKLQSNINSTDTYETTSTNNNNENSNNITHDNTSSQIIISIISRIIDYHYITESNISSYQSNTF
ncbi:hypothetical protein PIROE2DRAFT_16014 [Piromyces sp. E2]|nr:hypothetical protein PIROE2DRAFT_16014 [Piromyces sp. E2]|eukprot:OUM58657.1 hypothetical protein PIROE2DRAFT_16014 [Piromyces sp. E2]